MPEITIHEGADGTGERVVTRLSFEDGRLALVIGGEILALPEGALEAVMRRYGRPLDAPSEQLRVEERLDLGEEKSLVRFRFLARYDVIAKDYLALHDGSADASCELAASVTAALTHLARSFAGTR